ncbi:MAG: hypothetical protein A2007_00090 [Verrucomicrobia bacterium GWC2_42_7]|nr:MAG: hypothetical protein A2007_00090 [Verrucomicrobia bacterium GWC2_42_7]
MTSLLCGIRVKKTHPIIRACASIDELTAAIGLARAHLSQSRNHHPQTDSIQNIQNIQNTLLEIQKQLYALCSDLSSLSLLSQTETAPNVSKNLPPSFLKETHLAFLETMITELERGTKINAFVYPGNNPIEASLHHARTICRRSEIDIVAVSEKIAPLPPLILQYINRLSDVLFLLAAGIA